MSLYKFYRMIIAIVQMKFYVKKRKNKLKILLSKYT